MSAYQYVIYKMDWCKNKSILDYYKPDYLLYLNVQADNNFGREGGGEKECVKYFEEFRGHQHFRSFKGGGGTNTFVSQY